MLGFHLYFDIRPNQNGRAVSSKCRPHFTPKDILWYSFLSEAEWTPGQLNADRRMRTLESFQGTYRESNTEPPVLWRSAFNQLRHLFNFNTLIVKLFVKCSLARPQHAICRDMSHTNCASAGNLVFVVHCSLTESKPSLIFIWTISFGVTFIMYIDIIWLLVSTSCISVIIRPIVQTQEYKPKHCVS